MFVLVLLLCVSDKVFSVVIMFSVVSVGLVFAVLSCMSGHM